MADFDLYDDLELLHAEEKQKAVEDLQWKEKYQVALGTIEKLQAEKKELRKQVKQLEINFASLLDTARTEIKRKDNQIAELRREKDDICFRRNVRPVKEHSVDNNASERSRAEGGHFNPFSLETLNTGPKSTKNADKPVDENVIAHSSRRRDGDYEKRNSRNNHREEVPESVGERDRSHNKSRDVLERRGGRSSGQRRGGFERDLSQVGSSDSSRGTADNDRNERSHRFDHREGKHSNAVDNRHPSSKQNLQQKNKYESDKDPKKIESKSPKYKNDRLEDCPKINKTTSIENKDRTDKRNAATLEEEILNDVKKLKKMKLSEAEKATETEVDTIKAATEKSNEFLEALFDDMVMNVGEEPSDIYNDLEAAQPMDTCVDVECLTKVNDKNTEEMITKTDVNCNDMELQLYTPLKQSVTTLFDDLFGPSPAVSTSTIDGRRNSVSSVGEASSDAVEFIPIVGEGKIVKSVNNQNDKEKLKGSAPVSTAKADSKKNSEEVKTMSNSSLTLETQQNVAVDAAKAFKLIELDLSFYSSEEEENEKERNMNQTESQSDIESPPFENCDVTTVPIEKIENPNLNNSEKDATETSKKPICETISSGSEAKKITGLENTENRVDLTSKLQHKTDDVQKDQTHKLSNQEKRKSHTSRHSSEKKREENTEKDSHRNHHSSKQYTSSSGSRSSSAKDSCKSERSQSGTDKHHHHHHHQSTKSKHESHRSERSESEKNSTSHKSSQSRRKSSKDIRHHTGHESKVKNVTDAPKEKILKDPKILDDHHADVPSKLIKPVLQEDSSSDLKLYQGNEISLRCEDISDEEEVTEDKQKASNGSVMNVIDVESPLIGPEMAESVNLTNGLENADKKSSDYDASEVMKDDEMSPRIRNEKIESSKGKEEEGVSTTDATLTTSNVDEPLSDCVDLLTVVESSNINEGMESDCILVVSDVEKPSTSTKSDDQEPVKAEKQATTATVELTGSTIGGRVVSKAKTNTVFDCVPVIGNVKDQTKVTNEQIKSNTGKQGRSNSPTSIKYGQVEQNVRVDCVQATVETEQSSESTNDEKHEVNANMVNLHVEATKSVNDVPMITDSEINRPTTEKLSSQMAEIPSAEENREKTRSLDNTGLSPLPQEKEESVSGGRRKKLKTPRKCTNEGKINDSSTVETTTLSTAPKQYAKSDDEHSSVKRRDPLNNQRRAQSTSDLAFVNSKSWVEEQNLIEKISGVASCTDQDFKNSVVKKMPTVTLTPEKPITSSTEASGGFCSVEDEMPALRGDIESGELLSASIKPCGEELNPIEMSETLVPHSSNNLEKDKQESSNMELIATTVREEQNIEATPENEDKALIPINDSSIHHNPPPIFPSSSASCVTDSSTMDDSKNHSNKCDFTTASTIDREKHGKKDIHPLPVSHTTGATSNTQSQRKKRRNQRVIVYSSCDSAVSNSNNNDEDNNQRTSQDVSDSHLKDKAAIPIGDTDSQPNDVLDNSLEVSKAVSCDNKKYKKRNSQILADTNVTEEPILKHPTKAALISTEIKKRHNRKIAQPATESDAKYSTSAVADDSQSKEKRIQNTNVQDSIINETKKRQRKKNLQISTDSDVKNNEILAQGEQHEDIAEACLKRSLVVRVVKVPTNEVVNQVESDISIKKDLQLDDGKGPEIVSTDPRSKEADTSFSVCSSQTVVDHQNVLELPLNEEENVLSHSPLRNSSFVSDEMPLSEVKLSENLQHVKPPLVTSSTIDHIESNLNESSSGDGNTKIKANTNSKRKKRMLSSSSDSINVIDDKAALQTKRCKKLQNQESPSTNGYDNTSSTTTTTSKPLKKQRAAAKRKRTSSRESSLSSATAATPTHHKIFQEDVSAETQEPPVYISNDDDVQYQEIDNRMRSMFQSPIYNQSNGECSFDQTNGALLTLKDINSNENLTIEETLNYSEKSQCDTSSSSRKISVGSNDYVIETVGAHTANVFITRKKCKKRMKVAVATA